MQTVTSKRFSVALLLSGAALAFSGVASAQQYVVSTIAGSPTVSGYTGDGGPALGATFFGPIAIAADRQGNYYVADYLNNVVRKVYSNGVINTFAGTGTFGYTGDGGPATAAQISTVHGLAVDAAGNVYIADTANGSIRKVDTNGIITTFAGNGIRGYSGNFGPAVDAQLVSPAGLAFDAAGNLYVADAGTGTIRQISSSGTIYPYAGNGFPGFGAILGQGGYAFDAVLALPYAVAVDSNGNVYVGDVGAAAIAKIGTDGHINTIVTGVSIGSLAADGVGNVFWADYTNNVIGRIGPDGTIGTAAGNYVANYNGDGGPGIFAELNRPYGVATDSLGNIYVAEYGNQDVRLLTPIAPATLLVTNAASDISVQGPGGFVVAPGELVTLFGYALGDPATAQPDQNGNLPTTLGNSTVTVNGVLAPILATSPGQVTIVIPASTSGPANFVVTYEGGIVGTATSQVFATLPGIFSSATTANVALALQNNDGTVNTTGNPAADASNITFFITGAGPYTPGVPASQIAPASINVQTALPISVIMNGESAAVVSVQTVAGQLGSILQVVATIPSDITAAALGPVGGAAVPLQVKVSNIGSPTISFAVQ